MTQTNETTVTSNVGLKLAAALVAFAAGIGAVVTVLVLAHQTPSSESSASTGSRRVPGKRVSCDCADRRSSSVTPTRR